MNNTERLAKFVADLTFQDLPSDVVAMAKRCVRDSLGCMLGGYATTSGRIIANHVSRTGGRPEATLCGVGLKVPSPQAGFGNAHLANVLDFDDTCSGHPGATVIPSALAAAEAVGADGKTFITAVVAGYETSIRVMSTLRPMGQRFVAVWDLGTLQAYGAAAAAAACRGLDVEAVANVFGLVSATAPTPLPRKPRPAGRGRSDIKSAYGFACWSALTATELTEAGLSGPSDALENPMWAWDEVPAPDMGLDDLTTGLGELYLIEEVEFKPYPACRFLHSTLEAVEQATQAVVLDPERIIDIEVCSYRLLGDEYHNILRPSSAIDAQFSVPYCVAALILGGRLRPGDFTESAVRERKVLDLASRVRWSLEPRFDEAFPVRLGSRVRISLTDGTLLEATVEHPKGSTERPMSEDELVAKFTMLSETVIGEARSGQLEAMLDSVDSLDNVRALGKLLGG